MILDTNALSALSDGDRTIAIQLELAEIVALPVIVLGEWQYGIRRSRRRAQYESWLATLLARIRVLTVDAETATCYADVREELRRTGRPIPENDIWIAALGIQHSIPILTHDSHFDLVPGLRRIDWQ